MQVEPGAFIHLIHRKNTYLVPFRPDSSFSTHKGEVHLPANLAYGERLTSSTDENFIVTQPKALDLMLKCQRSTTIVYPKDAGMVLLQLGIRSASKVLELGSGTGAFTLLLSQMVGAEGVVHSIDIDPEKQKLSKLNLTKYQTYPNVTWHIHDMNQSKLPIPLSEAVFMDIPDPWNYIPSIRDYLEDGRPLGALCPSFEQVKATSDALFQNGFTHIRCIETLERSYYLRPHSTRPFDTMVGHTAFFVFGDKICQDKICQDKICPKN